MTQQNHPDTAETDPAQAFEALRGEIIRLGRLVDHLGSAPDRTHDYSPTLADMAQALKVLREGQARIEASPALRLAPETLADRMLELSQAARAEDRQMLLDAHTTIQQAIGRIDGIVERGQTAVRQRWQQRWRAAALVTAGMLIWAIVPGMLARSAPESWHVPEWMASRTMARDMKGAGERLLAISGERDQQLSAAAERAARAKSAVPGTRPSSRH